MSAYQWGFTSAQKGFPCKPPFREGSMAYRQFQDGYQAGKALG